MHNSTTNRAPSAEIHNVMHELPIIFYELLFLTYVSRNTPISCGTGAVSINAYFLGIDLLEIEKC